MGLAPLDVWVRMLLVGERGGAWRRLKPGYWLRLAWCVFTSALATALTLPERALVGAWLSRRWTRLEQSRRVRQPFRGVDDTPSADAISPGASPAATRADRRCAGVRGTVDVLCVLGYYRSGTTHLHYTLSCDPANTTPRWYQVLAPQGWVLSWVFLRWFLVPFLGSTRPQDDVAIGPEWPAEDDFALCNWTLSSPMPGRMVLPREWEHWKRLHAMANISARERRRWRRAVWGFAWKVSRAGGRGGGGGPSKRIILKTPSHTARIRELIEVFGAEHVKFIHITREPGAVLRSNIAMHRRFGPYLLQDPVGDEEVRRRIIEEYDATERAFLDDHGLIPTGNLARMRYQDLVADPMGELRRTYDELGLAWSAELESRFVQYLRSVADYRAAGGAPSAASSASAEPLPAELRWMVTEFEHDRAPKPTAALPGPPAREPSGTAQPTRAPMLDTATLALVWVAVWIGVAWVFSDRLDWMTWPTGALLGLAALRLAGRGSVRLGAWSAGLTLASLLIVAYPATCLAFYRDRTPMPFGDVWDSTRDGLLAINNLVWLFLGLMTAYRFASRKHVRAPGG